MKTDKDKPMVKRDAATLANTWKSYPRWQGIERGYTATRHQREVGTGYFDDVANVIAAGQASTAALEDSTEQAQF